MEVIRCFFSNNEFFCLFLIRVKHVAILFEILSQGDFDRPVSICVVDYWDILGCYVSCRYSELQGSFYRLRMCDNGNLIFSDIGFLMIS